MPADWQLGIVPASDTGAVEMALWSMLGARGVDVLAWESFGEGWVTDIVKQLKLTDVRTSRPTTASFPIWPRSIGSATWCSPGTARPRASACPTATGSPADREGLAICDATSAVFAMDLPWDKLDVVTWSWQKVLGGEAAHGMLALSPRAVERLETYKPAWPLPKIFRMTKGGKLIEGIFEGETINTPSMLAVEDQIDALKWADSVGGLKGLIARSEANLKVSEDWVAKSAWAGFLTEDADDPLVHLDLPQGEGAVVRQAFARRAGGRGEETGVAVGEGRRGLRYRQLSRRAPGPAHLGRRHRRSLRYRGADAWLDWAFHPGRVRIARQSLTGVHPCPRFSSATS